MRLATRTLSFLLAILVSLSSPARARSDQNQAGVVPPATGNQARPISLTTREISLGRVVGGLVECCLVISPDRQRVAYGSRGRAVVDGLPGPQYSKTGTPVFSADSKRVAYAAMRTPLSGNYTHFVVVDGVEGKEYKWSGAPPAQPVFSLDGRHLAFIARTQPKSWSERDFVVVDDTEGEERTNIANLVFSPDGKRVAYLVGFKSAVVVDGILGKTYDEIAFFGFSPDSRRFGYWAKSRGVWRAVIDGEEATGYAATGPPCFSPDNKRVAYAAIGAGKLSVEDFGRLVWTRPGDAQWFLVVDGDSQPGLGEMPDPSLLFSPDGRRIAYLAKHGRNDSVVVDGSEGKPYRDVDLLRFSPDGKRVAYLAERKVVVVDGVEGKRYDEVGLPHFSPDSKRVAYWAKRGGRQFVVVDGAEGVEYDGVGEPVFGPDGRRVAFQAKREHRWVVVVDNTESKEYARILLPDKASPAIVFDGPDRARFMATARHSIREQDILRVELEISGRSGQR